MSTIHRLVPRRGGPPVKGVGSQVRAARKPSALRKVKIDRHRLALAGMIDPDGDRSLLAEEMRIIRRPLLTQAMLPDAPAKDRIILVTSARPGEGKTFTSVNLALSLAQEHDLRVVLIDADATMRGSIRTLGIADRPSGLTTLLGPEPPPLTEAMLRTDIQRFSFIAPGRREADQPELFSGKRMSRLLEALLRADPRLIVVIDAPPVLATSEALALAPHAGQTLFVVEADSTPRRAVEQAVELIAEHSDVQLLLNKASIGRAHSNYAYYYYHSYNDPAVLGPKRKAWWWRRLFGGGSAGLGLTLWVSLAAAPVALAGWVIVPRIELATAFTDNVESERNGERDADLVTKVAPGVHVEGERRRVNVLLDYAFEAVGFATHRGESALRHKLEAAGRAEIVEDLAFVDVRGDIGDVFVDESGPTSVSEFNTSDNRTTRIAGSISPYVKRRLGDWAELEARYRLTQTNYGSDQIADVRANTLATTLQSIDGNGPLGWKATVAHDDADFAGTTDQEARHSRTTLAAVDTTYRLTDRLALLSGLGYSRLEDDTRDNGGETGPYWQIGFDARPTSRTRVRATGGQLFGEPNIDASAEWRLSGATTVEAGYVDRLSSRFDLFRRELENRDPFAEVDEADQQVALAADSLLPEQSIAERDDSIFRQRRADLSVTTLLGRNLVRLGGHLERRDLDLGTDQDIVGADLLWTRQLDRQSELQLGAAWRNVDEGNLGSEDAIAFNLAWSRDLSPTTKLTIGYQRDQLLESEQRDTTIDTVFLRVRKEF